MSAAVLELILSAQKYQRQLMETLGFTEAAAARAGLAIANKEAAAAAKAALAHKDAAAEVSAVWDSVSQDMSLDQALAASRAQLADLADAMASHSRTMDTAASHVGRYGTAMQSVAVQIPDVITQLQMGVSPMQVFSQQGLQVVQVNMGLVTSAAKALAATLTGPWGLALAGAVAAVSMLADAWSQARDDSDALTRALDDQAGALSTEQIAAATRSWEQYESTLRGIQETMAIHEGQISDIEIATSHQVEALREEARARLLEVATRWAALEVARQELEAQIQSGRLSEAETLAAQERIGQLRTEIPLAKKRLDVLREEVATQIDAVNANTQKILDERAAEDAARRARDAARDAAAAQADAAREADRLAREQKRAYEQQVAGQLSAAASLREIVRDSNADTLSEEQAIMTARDEQLAQIRAMAVEYGIREEASSAMTAVEARAERELASLREEQAAEEMARIDALRSARIDSVKEVVSATSGMFGELESAASALGDSQIASSERVAMALWRVEQAAAAARIIVDTAATAMSSARTMGPAGAVAAIALGAAQLAAVAAAEPPSFHTGGLLGDEQRGAYVQTSTEMPVILTRRGFDSVGGEQGISRANAGAQPASLVVPMALYEHRIQDLGVKRQRKQSSPKRAEIRTGIEGQVTCATGGHQRSSERWG